MLNSAYYNRDSERSIRLNESFNRFSVNQFSFFFSYLSPPQTNNTRNRRPHRIATANAVSSASACPGRKCATEYQTVATNKTKRLKCVTRERRNAKPTALCAVIHHYDYLIFLLRELVIVSNEITKSLIDAIL